VARIRLVRYDFSGDVMQPNVPFQIYTKQNPSWHEGHTTAEQAIERVLTPSGFWRAEYGQVRFVSISVDSTLA